MKLPRYSVDMMRQNVEAFMRQEHGDTCVLMPWLPKRILFLLDTIDELYDEKEGKHEATDVHSVLDAGDGG